MQDTNTARVILGPDGQPARLRESQRTEALLGDYDGYLAASYRLPPFNPDVFIASRGYQVLDDQMTMVAARAPLNIVRSAALYKGWSWEPAIKDQTDPLYSLSAEIAEVLTWACQNIVDELDNVQDFREVLWELLYAVHTGFRVTEIIWRVLDKEDPKEYRGKLGFKAFSAKPCKQIGFDLEPRTFQVRNITSYTPLEGYNFSVPVEKVLRYTYNSRDSLPFGNGVGRANYKHAWSIDFLYKFWNIAQEVFGSPFILGKAAPNAIGLARKVLAEIRQGAPAVLPSGVDAELVQVAAGGLASFLQAVQHHKEECAYGYLNSTLTTTVGDNGGNKALGQVHQDTSSYGLGGVRTDLENVMTFQLARRFVRYNYGPEYLRLTPRLSLGQWDAVDMSTLSTAYSSLISNNVMHEAEPSIRERLNIPPAPPEQATELQTRRAAKTDGAKQSAEPAQSSPPPTAKKDASK